MYRRCVRLSWEFACKEISTWKKRWWCPFGPKTPKNLILNFKIIEKTRIKGRWNDGVALKYSHNVQWDANITAIQSPVVRSEPRMPPQAKAAGWAPREISRSSASKSTPNELPPNAETAHTVSCSVGVAPSRASPPLDHLPWLPIERSTLASIAASAAANTMTNNETMSNLIQDLKQQLRAWKMKIN